MVTQSIKPQLHVFEAAGLGKAPFRYFGSAIGSTCCDYCGTHIVNQFIVESADSKRFTVGCECIKKTDDSALIKPVTRALKWMTDERRRSRMNSPDQIARELCQRIMINYAGRLSEIPCNVPASVGPPNLLTWSKWMLAAGVPGDLLRRLRSALSIDA